MDVASPSLEGCQARNEQKYEDDSGHMYSGSGEFVPVQVNSCYTVQLRTSHEDATNACDLRRYETVQVDVINTSKSISREKRTSSNLVSRKYVSRSSLEGARGVQSKTVGDSETAHPCTDAVHGSTEGRNNRQSGKEAKKVLRDEFFSLRKRFRYLLTRMGYEQNLIDAYSSEGWKGQSLEKIRPKKELQRATSEILRCKLEMRELVKHLDALCAEGKLQASSFDYQGQINCEDIYCAKCGSKDSSASNDIILCDGICERGFHQMCLVPPLLNEEIPPGEEIWLCPGCKCKVHCIDLLNGVQGTRLSIQDKWEKVFPEAAGDKHCAEFGQSDDDSEDSDFDPNGQKHNEGVLKECSSSEESDFTSASDDLNNSDRDEQHEGGFSSDDSEDNDYDPSVPDIDKMVHQKGSRSNESDFTSDYNDLSAIGDVNESASSDEDSLSFPPGFSEPVTSSCKGRSDTVIKEKESSVDYEQLSMQEQNHNEVVLPVLRKRHHERLDYKKLYDEAYGNIPFDSSEDEDWTEMNTPKKVKNDDFVNNNVMSSDGNTRTVQSMKNFKVPKRMHQKKDISPKSNKDQMEETGNTANRIICQKLESKGTNHSDAKLLEDSRMPDSVRNRATTSASRCFGKVKSQKLYESLKVNVYPTRETKEILSKELGITVRQISKWFENARRSLRLSSREGNKVEEGTTNNVLAEANGLDPDSKNGGGVEKNVTKSF